MALYARSKYFSVQSIHTNSRVLIPSFSDLHTVRRRSDGGPTAARWRSDGGPTADRQRSPTALRRRTAVFSAVGNAPLGHHRRRRGYGGRGVGCSAVLDGGEEALVTVSRTRSPSSPARDHTCVCVCFISCDRLSYTAYFESPALAWCLYQVPIVSQSCE